MDTSQLAFVDVETTGLDPERHEIWDVGLIVDDVEHQWFLPVDLSKADPAALNVGRYHERYVDPTEAGMDPYWGWPKARADFAAEFAELTRDRHLVGAVISFDEERLRKFLRANGECPMWHYHLIDVETLAVGYLAARNHGPVVPDLPWDSAELTRSVGIEPEWFDKHTALGDANWAKAIFEAVMVNVP